MPNNQFKSKSATVKCIKNDNHQMEKKWGRTFVAFVSNALASLP